MLSSTQHPLFSLLNIHKASWTPAEWREYQDGWDAAKADYDKPEHSDALGVEAEGVTRTDAAWRTNALHRGYG